ncbi:MAG: hypothetical protein Q9214_004920, partial [Letrouitia sp. 1 TL-2023]
VQRSPSYNPVFQAFINYRQGAREKLKFGNCELEGAKYEVGRTGYDINLDVIENAGGETTVMFMAKEDLYSQRDTEILANSFQQLLQNLSRNTSTIVNEATLFSKDDVACAIQLSHGVSFHNTWQTVIHRVNEVIAQNPHSPALIDGCGSMLTYERMSRRVNAIAASLQAYDVKPDDIIAIFQEPTTEWICTILAILRIGATYVPLDLSSPIERVKAVIADCRPTLILVHSNTLSQARNLQGEPARIINISKAFDDSKDVANLARPESTAVILYTSGSTGVPKGVLLGNGSLAHKVEDSSRHLGIRHPRVLQQSAFSFDFSLWQIFIGLTNAGLVYVVPKDKRGDPVAIMDLVLQENITLTGGTPSEYTSWLRYGAGRTDSIRRNIAKSFWKTVIVGGEQLSESLKQEFATLDSEGLRLHNIYGPSEVTIYSHSIDIDYRNPSKDRVPVGRVAANYSAVVVDQNLKAVPAGVLGEIIISGAGVAKGYLNRSQLMTEKFISDQYTNPNPLSNRWSTAFRTGDKGRLDDDGVLTLEGRTLGDTQIKLRGIRIELNDIEAAISVVASGILEDITVTVRGNEDNQYIVAHVVFASQQEQISEDLKQVFLKELPTKLAVPQYMVPAVIVPLPRMPLNAHGKIDRLAIQKLPIPEIAKHESTTQLSNIERQLKSIWEDVIDKKITDLSFITPETDFFHIGGNSLLLMKLQNRLRTDFGSSIPLVQLFETSTLRSMGAIIAADSTKVSSTLNIDWEYETRLPLDLVAPSRKPLASARKIIVLSGASGFLGKHLLQLFLADTSVLSVHAIAVRNPDRLRNFAGDPKVRIHKGNLAEPHFGLSPSTLTEIFASASVIVHNAAEVSFLKSYHTLKRTNVESTKNLLRLALPFTIPIHFVSTATLAQYTGLSVVEPGSVGMFPPPIPTNDDGSGASDGYAATKWVSEQLLERASTTFELPVTIHRPSAITGDGAPQMDVMQNLLHYSALTRTVPCSDRVKGWLDFVSVEKVARGIVESALDTDEDHMLENGIRYLFESGEAIVPVDELQTYVERQCQGPGQDQVRGQSDIQTVATFREWVNLAEQKGLDPLVGEFFRSLDNLTRPIVFPGLKGRMFDTTPAAAPLG